MSDRIHVELTKPCEADDFLAFLRHRGLSGEISSSGTECELDIGYTVEPSVRLRHEVEAALAAWLEAREAPLVPVAVDGDGFVVRPPGD